jgi:hypothetical protein
MQSQRTVTGGIRLASREDRGGIVRILTGAGGAERGSEGPEPASLEGGGGARSQASAEPGHEDRNPRESEATTPTRVRGRGLVEASREEGDKPTAHTAARQCARDLSCPFLVSTDPFSESQSAFPGSRHSAASQQGIAW